MQPVTEFIQPFDVFLGSLLEKSEQDIEPEMRQEFADRIECFLSRIETLTAEPVDIFKEILDLLKSIEMYIVSDKREDFMRQVKLALWKSNVALVETLSEKSQRYTREGLPALDKKWHDLRARSETWKRRFQLVSPATAQDFEATLMWMAERGVEEDLDLLRQVKKNPPYSSANVMKLLGAAGQRISDRVYGPDKSLQNFFNLSDEQLTRLTATVDAVENLRLIKGSLEALSKPEEIRRWLRTPKSMFAGRTPIELIIRGEWDRISEILVRLEEGVHN